MALAKRGMASAPLPIAWAMARALLCAVVASSALSGCGVAMSPGSVSVFKDADHSEDAMGALGRGDLVKAEDAGNKALRNNPNDPHALLALAIVYQNTGRTEVARQYYEVLLSMHSQAVVMNSMGGQPRTVDDIARTNLAAISGYVVPLPPNAEPAAQGGSFSEDGNLVLRFQTLRRLLEQGLITREEYDQRRLANLGALLQYTAPRPPAYGLGRPAPEPTQIIERLKAIAANYQEQSISAEEQSVERGIILEALMPAKVDRRADRPSPIADDIGYSAKLGRLQRFLDGNIITKAEADRERKALGTQLAAANAQKEAMANMAASAASGVPEMVAPVVSSNEGVALGRYGSKKGAERAWQSLQKQFPAELSTLTPRYARVGTRRRSGGYQLSAGPVADLEAAKKVCRALKLYDLNCSPTILK